MDIFSKLNSLKSIEPSESWIIETKGRVFSENTGFSWSMIKTSGFDVNENKREELRNIIDEKSSLVFNLRNLGRSLLPNKMAVSAISIFFVLFAGFFTVNASKSSLPGDFLYSIKIVNENLILAIAPEEKKAEIEIEHAGKRLEEIAKVSQKTSDVGQKEKIEKLVEKFEEKIVSANDRLTKIEKNDVKGKIAKVVNTQSEKYTEVLTKTTENLPTAVKNNISDKVAKAIGSSEKTSLTSLAVMVEEMTDENKEEITAIVKIKVEGVAKTEKEASLKTENKPETNKKKTGEEGEIKTTETTESIKSIEGDKSTEEVKEELIKILGNLTASLDNSGLIEGASDEGATTAEGKNPENNSANENEGNKEEGAEAEIIKETK